MNDIVLSSDGNTFTLSEKNGALKSLRREGEELLLPSSECFVLYLRDTMRDELQLFSSGFPEFLCDGGMLQFAGHPEFPSIRVSIRLRTEQGNLYLLPEITGVPAGMTADHFELLPVTFAADSELLYPFSEGVLVAKPGEFEFNQVTFPDRFYWWGYYPGICQMQFMLMLRRGKGVYFAAHDPEHGPKNIAFGGAGEGAAAMHIEFFCGGDVLPEFEYVLGAFDGNWMDGAERYRDWLEQSGTLPAQPPKLPAWVDDSPVIVVAPVCGTGSITSEPNGYIPYENLMPHIRRLAEQFDSRIMSHLMRYDQHGPWTPPYLWPPRGGAESMTEYCRMLHHEGHLLGLYGSGTSFTIDSPVSGYSIREEFETNHCARYMTRGPHGEIKADICGRIRDAAGMCMSQEWCVKIFEDQVLAMAEAGIDFIQLLDQNLGGASLLCYSGEHGHPATPGPWLTAQMKNFLSRLNRRLREEGKTTLLGTECAAAESYFRELPMNDLRTVFTYHYGMPVPLHSFLFHEYCADFMGNQAGVTNDIRCAECPENILWRIAYAFNAGNLLSVTLRDKGVIDWGAAADWNSEPPDQEPIMTLIRNLNRLRRRYPQFLRSGRMIRPLCNVSGGSYELKMVRRPREVIDSFTHSSWRSPAGEYAMIVTNFLPVEQTVTLTVPDGVEVENNGGTILRLPPLTAKVLPVRFRENG